MKKFLINLGLFIPVSVVCYVFLLIFWGEFVFEKYRVNLIYKSPGYGHTFSRMKEAKEAPLTNILFLGSSQAYRGFDVRYMFQEAKIFGFNLGSSAQSPVQTKMLVNRYLDTLSPKLVIVEVAPTIFGRDGVESSLDLIANDVNDMETIKMALATNHLKTYNTMIYAFYRDWFSRNKGKTEKVAKGKDRYRKNGYVEKKMSYYKYGKRFKREIVYSEKQVEAFDDIIDTLKNRKIPYILVQAPITEGLYGAFTNMDDFEEFIKKKGPYYDFNKILKLDDSLHFYDAVHLNQHGVERFNKKLIDTLQLTEI
jgi:hypothetical protein